MLFLFRLDADSVIHSGDSYAFAYICFGCKLFVPRSGSEAECLPHTQWWTSYCYTLEALLYFRY
jgi:hypothetical protein